MNKAIFLDRDGVLNEDKVDYVYKMEDCKIINNIPQSLKKLKEKGFLLIIITNQSGIAKGIYTQKEVLEVYDFLQKNCENVFDDHYFAPHHPKYTTESLSRKPDSLMLERAIAKYNIDIEQSWFVGDSNRDILAGQKIGIRTIKITHGKAGEEKHEAQATLQAQDLTEATNLMLGE
jgi:D-glycero-D-manno-heptose 1,7-bisphosphate phosphatase